MMDTSGLARGSSGNSESLLEPGIGGWGLGGGLRVLPLVFPDAVPLLSNEFVLELLLPISTASDERIIYI